ncbi:lysine-specific demethylase JMJ28-like [Rutidosis leptorrhynchoides]|uniref:lysine-specific demethylase JMJ28-like n=1 Tax=Rutidosis leptorrhynchoides TaxID=125765 RepID=UPI003A990FFD
MSELSNDERCRRNDGRGWRCKLSVVEGRGYCERHLTQGILRKKRQPVPDHLKFERARRSITPKVEPQELEPGSNVGEITDLPLPRTRAAGNKRMRSEEEASDDVVVAKEPKIDDNFGCGSSSIPESPVKRLPSNNKQNVKATVKKKINNKCHWCRLSSYRVLVKCSTCKKQYFCEDCIDRRFHCKNTIMRECPVCLGECTCQACTKAKPKNAKTKEPVINEVDEDVSLCDPEMEINICNRENEEKSQRIHIMGEPVIYEVNEDVTRDSENEMNVCNRENKLYKSQRLHIIGELLPVIEKMHHEIMNELDTEANDRGKSYNQIKVQYPKYPRNKECSFCKGCITVVQRSCDRCGYIFCLSCCEDYRNGYIHTRLKNLKTTRCVRTKKSINVSWNLGSDGSITCPPKNLGGCGDGILNLSSFSPLGFAKIVGDNAKLITERDNTFKKDGYALTTSSTCSLCDDDNISGLRFCTKKEFMDMNLEHFVSHWGKGKPVIILNVVFKDLNWDFGFLLCEYLKKSAKFSEVGPVKGVGDWLDVNFGSKRIISRGKSESLLKEFVKFKNVLKEFVKFELRLPGGFLQDNFPSYYDVIMKNLPIQEYFNPITGSYNLAANNRDEDNKSILGFYVHISHGGFEDSIDADVVSNLRLHAHDVVNVLVNATAHPLPETVLNDVNILMNEYNSKDKLKTSKKFDEKSDEESDDEDLSQSMNTGGARWDIYRREDVPKIVEYLTKYSDELISTRYASPKKVVHPLFDEIFYLNDFAKRRLKEEYDVEAWSVEQQIGESVIVPTGCPYQMKKIKSCVNVVVEFISPESASECIKVCDEIRLLPVNHQAKWHRVQVKNMVIKRMKAVVDEVLTSIIGKPHSLLQCSNKVLSVCRIYPRPGCYLNVSCYASCLYQMSIVNFDFSATSRRPFTSLKKLDYCTGARWPLCLLLSPTFLSGVAGDSAWNIRCVTGLNLSPSLSNFNEEIVAKQEIEKIKQSLLG